MFILVPEQKIQAEQAKSIMPNRKILKISIDSFPYLKTYHFKTLTLIKKKITFSTFV